MVEGKVTGLPILSVQEVAVARGAMLMRARNEGRSPSEGEVAVLRLCDTVEAFRAAMAELVEAVDEERHAVTQVQREERRTRVASALVEARRVVA